MASKMILVIILYIGINLSLSAPSPTPFPPKSDTSSSSSSSHSHGTHHVSRRIVAHAVGDDVTFSCKASTPLPVLWRRIDDHKILAIGETPFDDTVHRSKFRFLRHTEDPRVYVMSIIGVQLEDGGEYQCGDVEVNVLVVIATPVCAIYAKEEDNNNDNDNNSEDDDDVKDKRAIPEMDLRRAYPPSSSAVQEGGVATLTCSVSSSSSPESAPKLIWRLASTARDFLLGEQIRNAARNVTSNVLRFRAAAGDDGHKYFCQLHHRHWASPSPPPSCVTPQLRVNYPPSVVCEKVVDGRLHRQIVCHVRGNPRPTVANIEHRLYRGYGIRIAQTPPRATKSGWKVVYDLKATSEDKFLANWFVVSVDGKGNHEKEGRTFGVQLRRPSKSVFKVSLSLNDFWSAQAGAQALLADLSSNDTVFYPILGATEKDSSSFPSSSSPSFSPPHHTLIAAHSIRSKLNPRLTPRDALVATFFIILVVSIILSLLLYISFDTFALFFKRCVMGYEKTVGPDDEEFGRLENGGFPRQLEQIREVREEEEEEEEEEENDRISDDPTESLTPPPSPSATSGNSNNTSFTEMLRQKLVPGFADKQKTLSTPSNSSSSSNSSSPYSSPPSSPLTTSPHFGVSIEDAMRRQRFSYPEWQLPWILVVLTEAVLSIKGEDTTSVFRLPADAEELRALKKDLDDWKAPSTPSFEDSERLSNSSTGKGTVRQSYSASSTGSSSSSSSPSIHALACMLKQWFRELRQPVVPSRLYHDCLSAASDAKKARKIVRQTLPDLNRRVLEHFVRFLRHFTDEGRRRDTAAEADDASSSSSSPPSTHMPLEVLCLVMAPLVLRPPSSEDASSCGGGVTQRLQKETNFMKTLILHLPVEEVEDSIGGGTLEKRNSAKGDVFFDV